MTFKEIVNLANKENAVIELKLGPDKAMTIIVYGKRKEWLTIGATWPEESIRTAIIETIRRAKE